MRRARVIGAGLSGLSAAWHLADQHVDVEVLEAQPSPGGLIGTTHTPWGLAEHAAHAFVWTPAVAELFTNLGIEPVFASDTSRRRYIFRDGRPRQWALTPLETLATVIRFGAATVTRRSRPRDGETVEAWAARTLGAAASRHMLGPALQGIYATPISRLSARAVFRHRRSRKTVLAVPREGMGALMTRFIERLEHRGVRIQFNCHVDALDPAIPTWICTSASAAARLVEPHVPDVAAKLAAVESAALAAVTTFFAPTPSDLRGFGVLFPRDAGVTALGVLFNTDVFPGRGEHRSETWIYGGPDRGALPPRESLPSLIAHDRQVLTGRDDTPLGHHVAYWPAAFPIYDEAVADLCAQFEDRPEGRSLHDVLPPWLHLAGNYLGRRGVADLIDHARLRYRDLS